MHNLLATIGIDWSHSIFGLHGILLAHVILNGAFATRILLSRLDALPAQKLRIGQSLDLTALQRFRVLDWPAITGALPGLGAIIFLLAFTSFPIVLMLGGGPANQTIEVAIYAAVRLEFDLNLAVQLALIQLVVCGAIIGPALFFSPGFSVAGTKKNHHWPDGVSASILQWLILIVATAGFALPLIATIAKGFSPEIINVLARPAFWHATFTSLTLGLFSAVTTLMFALGLAMGRNSFHGKLARVLVTLPAFVYLVVPAVVLALAFFLLVRNMGIAPYKAAPYVVILGNSLLSLPFAMAILSPALDAIDQRYGRLVQSLNIRGFRRWKFSEWPLLRTEIGITLALGFCFSLGDLGIISMFGTDQFTTLPWMMYRAMGAYRSNDAAVIAAFLLIISFAAFWLIPTLLNRKSYA